MKFEPKEVPTAADTARQASSTACEFGVSQEQKESRHYVDIGEFATELWKSKWLIVILSLLVLAITVLYVIFSAKWYQATVTLIPAEDISQPAVFGELSGLAGLVGIGSGGGGTAEAIAVLQSNDFTKSFIQERQLTEDLLNKKYSAGVPRIRAMVFGMPNRDLQEAAEFFDAKVRNIRENSRTGLVSVVIAWETPENAALWANDIVTRLNDRMRDRALREAEVNIEYLQNELRQTNIVSLQESLSRVLETEMQKMMIARGRQEYAFRVIDPAFSPRVHHHPRAALWLPVGLFSGLFFACLMIFARYVFKKLAFDREGVVSN